MSESERFESQTGAATSLNGDAGAAVEGGEELAQLFLSAGLGAADGVAASPPPAERVAPEVDGELP